MTLRETGKARADRIPYQYLASRDPLVFRKLVYSALALLAALGWVGWGWMNPEVGRLRESHGQLSRVHTTWEARCDACHVSPASISSLMNSSKWEGLASDAGDKKCMSCHMGQAHQAHHADIQKPGRTPHCVQCHSEHQGKSSSLVRLGDTKCTQCHSQLDVARNGPAQLAKISDKIMQFSPDSHPDFRFRRDLTHEGQAPIDPGKLKFNHSLHLTNGLRFSVEDQPLVTFKDLNEEDRARYGWNWSIELSKSVQLDCASCHHMDGGSSSPGFDNKPENTQLFRQKTPGAYVQPISYANDCSACHPIDLSPQTGGDRIALKHGLQPVDFLASIEARLLKSLFVEVPDLRKELDVVRIPGRSEIETTLATELDRRVQAAGRILLGVGKATCTECHYYESHDGKIFAEPDPNTKRTDLKIASTHVPEIWMKHARFDHASHRAVQCTECHTGVETSGNATSNVGISTNRSRVDGSPTWKSHEDVLLPGIATCFKCHAPSGQTSGGASFNCTECHLYHDRDASLAKIVNQVGRAGAPLNQRKIERFLQGDGDSFHSNPP